MLRTVVKRAVLAAIHAHHRATRARLGQVEQDLPPELWDADVSASGHLQLAGCDLVQLADTYGTPLHVVDRMRLLKNYREFRGAFAQRYPRVEVGYSYKTNPLPAALLTLHHAGADAEVISHFELWLALRLGVPPERIIFNGPGKTPEALQLAVTQGIKTINIDNVDEADAIQRMARQTGRPQRVGVRVITSVGWSSQFGLSIPSGAARTAFERMMRLDMLLPQGLHLHLGTGIRDVAIYLQAVDEILQFAEMLRRELGISIMHFDLGGGFGVPTVRAFSEWDSRLLANGYPMLATDVGDTPAIDTYADGIARLFRRYYGDRDADLPTMFLEPGRAVSSSAQTLLLRVLAVKPGKNGIDTVILDGGKNITMPLGYEYHEVFAASKMSDKARRASNLFGPLCHPGDVVCLLKRLPQLAAGDLVAVMDAGAYFIPNQMNFSNPRPAAVLVERGEATLVRSREPFEAIVALDRT